MCTSTDKRSVVASVVVLNIVSLVLLNMMVRLMLPLVPNCGKTAVQLGIPETIAVVFFGSRRKLYFTLMLRMIFVGRCDLNFVLLDYLLDQCCSFFWVGWNGV